MGPCVDDDESTPALPSSPTPTPMSDEDEDEDEATAPSEANDEPRDLTLMDLQGFEEADAAALYPGDWERRCRGCYPVFGGVVGYYEEGQGGHICQTCEYDL